MDTISRMGSGGVIIAVWKNLPGALKFLIAAGIGAVTAAEIVIKVNVASYIAQVEAGKAAQGQGQISDPHVSLDRYHDRRPVSSSEALTGAEVAEKDGSAGKAQAEAAAMQESVDDIRGKIARGVPITTTEQIQLIRVEKEMAELHAKEAEAQARAAEAKIKQAESTAADSKAKMERVLNAWVQCTIEKNRGNPMNALFHDPCAPLRPF